MTESASLPAVTPDVPGRHPTRIAILIGSLAAGAAMIGLAAHYHRPEPAAQAQVAGMTVGSNSVSLTSGAPQWSVVKVAAAAAAQPHWSDPVPARIVFDEAHASRLGSPLAGRVTQISVDRGQRVAAGAPLYTVASPGLAELRAEREKAAVQLATARVNLDRTQALVEGQSLPGKELLAVVQQVAEAELAVRLADQKLASLKVVGAGETAFTVTAPRDGVVVEKNLSVGQEIDASSGTVMAIADLSVVWVVADLFENDAGGVAAGAKVLVTASSIELEGVVAQVSAIVDPERHTVPVRVKLANPTGALRPNAYAQIRLFDATPAAVALPAAAVLSDGVHNYVYVQTAGAFVRREITAGSSSGGVVPVMSGLAPGESVVVQGAILLDNQIQLDN